MAGVARERRSCASLYSLLPMKLIATATVERKQIFVARDKRRVSLYSIRREMEIENYWLQL